MAAAEHGAEYFSKLDMGRFAVRSSTMNQVTAVATVALLCAAQLLASSAAAAQPVPRSTESLPVVTLADTEAAPFLLVPASQTSHGNDSGEAGIVTLLAGGAAVAGLSAALGAVIGYQVSRHDGGEDPGMSGLASGWLAGPALATPIAVHALNHGRGSLPLNYTLAAAIVLASVVTIETPIIFIASPVLQAMSATIVQRTTGQ